MSPNLYFLEMYAFASDWVSIFTRACAYKGWSSVVCTILPTCHRISKQNQLETRKITKYWKLGHDRERQEMKASLLCVLTRKNCAILSVSFCVFILLSMNLTTRLVPGHFIPINLDIYEVWHHVHTIGVLVLRGHERTLVKCRLILLEKE